MDVRGQFWKWFVKRQAEFFSFDEADRESVLDELAAELRRVDPDLTFEFGPEGSRREFVISAGGIKRAFPAVVSLANAAPKFESWKITAFRPRRWPPNIVEFQGKSVHPDDVRFILRDNGEIAGIYLFIPDFQEGDVALQQIGYLMLDETLGEHDVETRLGGIKMLSQSARIEGERFPLAELPAMFDQLVSRLEGRTGKPS